MCKGIGSFKKARPWVVVQSQDLYALMKRRATVLFSQ